MSYDRRWLEEAGSEDSHGRTLWALGECARHDGDPSRRRWAAGLFKTALPVVEEFTSPRAWAFTLLGLDAYCGVVAGDLFAQPHARTAGRQADDHACGKENRRLALVRGRARVRQCTPSSGSDRDGPGNSHAALRRGRPAIAALAYGAADHAVGLLQAGRDPKLRQDTPATSKRSISSRWKRLQRSLPVFLHGGWTAAQSGGWGQCGRSIGFWARTTCAQHSSIPIPAAAWTDSIRIEPTRTRAPNRRCHIFLVSWRCGSSSALRQLTETNQYLRW